PSTAASIMSIHLLSAGMALPGRRGTVFVLLLFAGTGSAEELLTVAVFESVPGDTTGGALIVKEIGLADPTARVGSVQVTTPALKLQIQPVPEALTKVDPAGSVSLTETLDAVLGPRFETETV